MHPADEFAQIRTQIAELEKRSKELREQFAKGHLPLTSGQTEIVVARRSRRSFQTKALPSHIREAPEFWKTTVSVYVTVKTLESPGQAQPPATNRKCLAGKTRASREVARRDRYSPQEADECILIEPF